MSLHLNIFKGKALRHDSEVFILCNSLFSYTFTDSITACDNNKLEWKCYSKST